jgi:HPt (histidine-containing phosphotransfer) domain-containing protein
VIAGEGDSATVNGETHDWSAALERLQGDRELLEEIAGVFREEAPKLLAQITEAVERDDAGALKLAAHTLKGALANFAATAAVEAARRLELMAKEGDLSLAGPALATLEREIALLTPALEAISAGRE